MTLPAASTALSRAATVPDGLPPPRAFGTEAGDLDLDFDAADRLVLATAVVARCVHRAEAPDAGGLAAHVWAMTVGARIARLLRIVALTEAADALEVVLRCPTPGCATGLAADLPIARILGEETSGPAAPGAPIGVELGDGKSVTLRRPTGSDQRAWRERSFGDSREALLQVVRTLGVSAAAAAGLGEEELGILASAMEEADPLTAFRVVATCPGCHSEVSIPVDLEAEALRRLAAAQRALLNDIHTLATHYGWSESDILAIPPRRRARYLGAIEAAEGTTP